MAIIEDLQSAIKGLKDILNSVRNTEQGALMQFSDGDGGDVYIQQGPNSIFQLQLLLRDLIRAIARLERSFRQSRKG